jgi:formate hydrogenlyase transcriptional activator
MLCFEKQDLVKALTVRLEGRFTGDGAEDDQMPVTQNAQHYQAVLRISEALVACRQPEELAKTLADLLNEFLSFEHLDVLILKEDSTEIEWHAWGKGGPPPGEEDLPIEDLPRLPVYSTQELLHIADCNADKRLSHVKQFLAERGVRIGSVVRVPLTTPHRRLGTLGIASAPGVTYGAEDVEFLKLIARVVAFALDDGLNLRRALAAQTRLQLLLNLTNQITSNLELREVLRAIAANIREVMQCDSAGISVADPISGQHRVHALDFPGSNRIVEEGLLLTPSGPAKEAFDTLKPIVVNTQNRDLLGPCAYASSSSGTRRKKGTPSSARSLPMTFHLFQAIGCSCSRWC